MDHSKLSLSASPRRKRGSNTTQNVRFGISQFGFRISPGNGTGMLKRPGNPRLEFCWERRASQKSAQKMCTNRCGIESGQACSGATERGCYVELGVNQSVSVVRSRDRSFEVRGIRPFEMRLWPLLCALCSQVARSSSPAGWSRSGATEMPGTNGRMAIPGSRS